MSTYIRTWLEEDDDGTEYERSEDVTLKVQKMERQNVTLAEKVTALQKDLGDLKNRRYWEEIELVTDQKTGMSAAIRTTYRWQAETMRLDFTPDMYNATSFAKSARP